jgi:hypothetical protein
MLKMSSQIALLVAALSISDSTRACQCAAGQFPMSPTDAREAPNVFEFRPLDLRAGPDGIQAFGRIEVIRVLKGSAEAVQSVRFNYRECCGIRLVPGMIYFAFDTADVPELHAHQGNIFQLPDPHRFAGDLEELLERVDRYSRDSWCLIATDSFCSLSERNCEG